MEQRYVLGLAVLAVLIVIGTAVSSVTWTNTSRKIVDVGIVIDENVLDSTAVFWSDQVWFQAVKNEKRDAFAKLVEDVVAMLVGQRYEIDARIAIMFHDQGKVNLKQSFTQTMGKSATVIAKVATKFSLEMYHGREGSHMHSGNYLADARNALSQADGNRPNVPDFLLWFAVYKKFDKGMFEPHERMRQQNPNGPDLIVTVEGTESQQSNVTIVGNGIENIATCWDEYSPSRVTDAILKILSSCLMEIRPEIQEPKCYFGSEGSCVSEDTYQPHAQNNPSTLRYCFNGTLEFPCEDGICQEYCDKAMSDAWECSGACGEGRKTVRFEEDTRKFLQHCPKGEKCDTGIVCPTSTPLPKTSMINLEPWHYAVIGVSGGAIIMIIVLVIVCKCCICAKKPYPKKHPRHGDRSHHGSQNTRFRSSAQARSGSQSRNRSRSRSRSSRGRSRRNDRSPKQPKYLEVPKATPAKLGTKKAPGTYVDLSKSELPGAPRRKSGYREL